MTRRPPLNFKIIFALLVLYSSVILVFFVDFKVSYLILFLINFLWFGLSSSLYYHRTITHKAAKLNLLVEVLFLFGGVISLSGSPIVWATVHRFHHAVPDTDNDPHSPLKGRLWAYMGWLLHQDEKKIEQLKQQYSKDLIENKLYRTFDRRFMLLMPSLIYGFIVYYFIGSGGLVWGFLLAGLLSYNFHWMFIASFCHSSKLGYRRFDTDDESRNVPWLILPSFGESLHNNHHKHPKNFSFSSGLWEFDISFLFVRFLEKLGLASNITFINYCKKD